MDTGLDHLVATGVGELTSQMAQAARLAPSIHNTQPWTFSALPDGLLIRVDDGRALPWLDPVGRLRAISCGAATTNAALAVAAAGFQPIVVSVSPGDITGMMAQVRRGGTRPFGEPERRRYEGLGRRRAHRRLHSREPVTADLVELLCEAVTGEGARPVVPQEGERRRLAEILRSAVHHQLDSPGFLAEVDGWIRHPGDAGRLEDGIPAASLGTTPYPADALVHDGWDDEAIDQIPLAEELAASTVLAIATRADTRHDWVIAGMALQRLWLEATALDLAVTFADQATQWDVSRQQAAVAIGAPGHLQIVLRVGRPLVDLPPTPRRRLDDLWAP